MFENEYDDPEKVQARKNQEDPWVMYLVVRESLNMGVGKIAAQVGHAVGMICRKYHVLCEKMQYKFPNKNIKTMDIPLMSNFRSWEQESFRKIVLKADDKEWEKLKKECNPFVVRDAGLTEVAAGSETVLGLWPMKKSQVPKIIKKLQVL